MNTLRTMVVLAGLLAITTVTNAQDFRQRFVGKSPCAPELQSEKTDFSLRLDKTQRTTLLYRDLSKIKVIMIVQPTGDIEHCGVMRDLVEITYIAKDFEFRCFDPQASTDVIIGTAIRKGSIKLVTAIDAWRIDLKEQKFVETHHKVVCSAEGWDGEDDGSDMVDEAKKYAAHGKPGQFGPEPGGWPTNGNLPRVRNEFIWGSSSKAPKEMLRKMMSPNEPAF